MPDSTNLRCPNCKKLFKNNELVVKVFQVSIQAGKHPLVYDLTDYIYAHQTCPTKK